MMIGGNRREARKSRRPATLLLAFLLGLTATAEARHHRKDKEAAPEEKPAAAAPSTAEEKKEAPQAPAVTDYPAAIKKAEESYRQAPAPETLFQLGQLYEGQGKIVEAQDFMRRYLIDPLTDGNAPGRPDAERVMTLPRPPSGEVQVLSDKLGLVFIDDRLVGALPLPLPVLVPPGSHVVSLEVREKTLKGKIKVQNGRGMEVSFSRAGGAVVVTLPPAVILVPQYGGAQTSPEEKRRLLQATEQSIQKARLAVFSKEVALGKSPKLADCLDTLSCQAQLAAENEVDYVLAMRVEHEKDSFSIKMQLIDAETADVAATSQPSCPNCNSDQLAAALPEAVRKLIKEGQGRQRGTLSVTSEPSDAEVKIGERVLGKTPYTHAAFVGSYEIIVEKPDFQSSRTQVEVREGKKEQVAVTLLPKEVKPPPVIVPPPPKPTRPKWRLIAGGIAVGTGVLMMGFGISAMAVNGQCIKDPGMGVQCSDRFATLPVGGALFGVGVAVAAGGAVLIALPPKRTP